MEIEITPVSQCLERKNRIFGFDIPDLLIIFLSLSVLNLVFGDSAYKIFFVWIPPLVLGLILKFSKKGRPENFLTHWIRFQMTPGTFKAFKEADPNPFPPTLKKGVFPNE